MTIQVFGITGTNGKTTTSYMLRSILKASGKHCSLVGTIGHHIGEKEFEAINTTPGAALLAEYFREMEADKTDCCVMEVSSHGLSQGRVDGIDIQYAAFTNLTRDHLDYHKTMEDYYQAKKRLFYLSKRVNLINIDDSYGRRLYEELIGEQERGEEKKPQGRVLSYSLMEEKADYFGQVRKQSLSGTEFDLLEKGEPQGRIHLCVPGDYSVSNALAAAGLAREDGISFAHAAAGLAKLSGVPGRFEVIGGPAEESVTAIVDYAHTPDALFNLLKTACAWKKGRLICVFGCGGERDREKRAMMGRIAGENSDYCLITSDNPRGENPEDIASDIEEGLYDTGCQYHIIIDRYQAIKWAVSIWKKGDIIVVAGKGHEIYQIIGKEKRPFDDRAVLREIIAGQE